MTKLVVSSLRKSAGKTSLIIGLAKAIEKNFGYIKPIGDRLLYRKKRLWDYDSALLTNIFGLNENPEDITIGFEHSKLRYIYDEKTTKEKLIEIAEKTGKGKEHLFIEGGKNLTYGTYVYLDAISVAENLDGRLILVLSGNQDTITDEVAFLKKYTSLHQNKVFRGVIFNKVQDVDDFKDTHLEAIEEMGVPVLGTIPYKHKMTYLSVDRISEALLAKVLAGETALSNVIKRVFIGAMSANAALRNPLFKTEGKLIITGGDREDMILAALREDTDTAAIVLTNNVVPSSQTISRAAERNVPLLLAPKDTFQAAKVCDDMEPLITKSTTEKIDAITKLVKEHVDIKRLLE
ncbi:MAG: DRTGG domain-containing protein [Candidatus Hodarchaeota archaeon]